MPGFYGVWAISCYLCLHCGAVCFILSADISVTASNEKAVSGEVASSVDEPNIPENWEALLL